MRVQFKYKNYFFLFVLVLVSVTLVQCSSIERFVGSSKSRSPEKARIKDDSSGSSEARLKTSPAIDMVTEGIEVYRDGDFNHAEWNFEEAIKVDPQYGPAYYWLARVKYKFSDYQASLNHLDRAGELLEDNTQWVERIDHFRNHIKVNNLVPQE